MSARWTTEEWYAAYLKRQQASAIPRGETRAWDARGGEAETAHESEKSFMSRLLALAKTQGFCCYHTHNSERSEPGFPDVVMTDGHSVLYCELKTNRGQLTMAQQRWLSLLEHAGQEVYVWRPKDWEEIVGRLGRKANLS